MRNLKSTGAALMLGVVSMSIRAGADSTLQETKSSWLLEFHECSNAVSSSVSIFTGEASLLRLPFVNDVSNTILFKQAMEEYKDGDWDIAYERFAALASRGHAESAQIVLQMLQYGSGLYGKKWEATEAQLNRWASIFVSSTSATNLFQPSLGSSLELRI